MADFMVEKKKDIIEYTPLVLAIDEKGAEVKVKGRKVIISPEAIDKNILRLEKEIARWKAVKSEVEGDNGRTP